MTYKTPKSRSHIVCLFVCFILSVSFPYQSLYKLMLFPFCTFFNSGDLAGLSLITKFFEESKSYYPSACMRERGL